MFYDEDSIELSADWADALEQAVCNSAIVYLDCMVVKIRQDKQVINKSIFPQTQIQHHAQGAQLAEIRFLERLQAVTADLKRVCRAATEEGVLLELGCFGEVWGGQYQQITKSSCAHWQHLNMLLIYPEDIRRVIYK